MRTMWGVAGSILITLTSLAACADVGTEPTGSNPGGSGNGPAYIQGPLTVTGSDIYGLDRDGDGIACDTN
jgi:hypothetical protein